MTHVSDEMAKRGKVNGLRHPTNSVDGGDLGLKLN